VVTVNKLDTHYEIIRPIRPNVITTVRKLSQYSQGYSLNPLYFKHNLLLSLHLQLVLVPYLSPFTFAVVNYVLMMYHVQPVRATCYHPNSHFLNAVYVVADSGTLPQSTQHAGMFNLYSSNFCFQT
jgi:hypothetical protein